MKIVRIYKMIVKKMLINNMERYIKIETHSRASLHHVFEFIRLFEDSFHCVLLNFLLASVLVLTVVSLLHVELAFSIVVK